MSLPQQPLLVAAAKRYGGILRRVLANKGIGAEALAGIGRSRRAVKAYIAGRELPSVETGRLIADSLCSERLAELIVELRTLPCAHCGRLYVHLAKRRRYCGAECRRLADSWRRGIGAGGRAARAEKLLNEVLGVLGGHRSAVDAMCWSCEPGGLCHQADCPLRAVSPLALAAGAEHPLRRTA